ncbi:MAG: hypothetical protein KBT03_13060 [Bacteroidales bacterium]|nr:hypothetical protein [Candidatus Scybalousia scybalohippi]
MNHLSIQQIKNGFVEAMYFADGADEDFKDDNGYYMDGSFNSQYDLSEKASENITSLLEIIIPKLPASIYELSLDRIGNCIYYHVQGHGVGFEDDLELSDDDKEIIYQLFFNSVFLEIYDNDDTQEIELSYSTNWN